MPILLSPRSKFPVILDSDRDAEPKPTFWFRAVDCQKWSEIADAFDTARIAELRGSDVMRDIVKTLSENLVGWDNMVHPTDGPIPFDTAKVGELVTITEAWELLEKLQAGNRLNHDEKKVCA